jgi:membrane-associated phospholipid phosphatase
LSSAVSIETSGSAAASGVASVADTQATRSRWWVEVGVIVWLCWVYDMTTNLAPLRLNLALGHARDVLHLERLLHLDPELSLDRWLAGHPTLGLILSDYYDNAHFIVTLGILGYLWWCRTDLYRPLRNSLVLVNVLGFIVFWLYPVAPPRMLKGYTDIVASSHAFGSWHTGVLASHANQLAAMPSLHMAWAAWCALALWRISSRSWVRVLAVLYPCMTALAVLATGNHFVLDILGGLVVMAIAALIVQIATARWDAARGPGGHSRVARRPFAKSPQPAYRMSQTCYEVRDRVD